MLLTSPQKLLLLVSLLLVCAGCSEPVLVSRVVQQEPAWFVRLDSFETADHASARYDHPASWKDEDLSAIMTRLFLKERIGLMDSAKPARALFSSEEITLLVSPVRQAFEKATSNEWVAFSLVRPHGGETAVTSGALLIEAHRLHVVVANHRALLAQNSADMARVRGNPLYSVAGSGGIVEFEPQRFGLGSKANWSGGHRASASELVLDHDAFFAYDRLSTSTAVSIREMPASGRPISTDLKSSHGRASDQGTGDQLSAVSWLQAEIERMKQQLAEKDREIERLKRESAQSVPRP